MKVPVLKNGLQQRVEQLVWDGLESLYSSMEQYRCAVSMMEKALKIPKLDESGDKTFQIVSDDLGGMWTPRFYKPSYVWLVNWLNKNFECRRLETIAHIERGKGTRVSDYATHGIPFVRTTSLVNFGIDPFPDHYASEDIQELFKQPVGEGDILYSIEGKIGHAAYLTAEDICLFKNHIELVRCHESVDSMFVYLVLSSIIGKAQADKNMVVQATLPGMASRLRTLLIPDRPRRVENCPRFIEESGEAVKQGYAAAKLRAHAVRFLRKASDLVDHALETAAK